MSKKQKKTKDKIIIKEIYKLVISKRIEPRTGLYTDYQAYYELGWNQAIETILALLRDIYFLNHDD